MVRIVFLLTLAILVYAQTVQSPQIDLLITGGSVVTMDSSRRILEPGYVAVSGSRIVSVGPIDALPGKHFIAKRTIDARGTVILPGLINTHTHIPMVLFRGLADDLELQEWLTKYIFPAEARNVTREFVRDGTLLGLAEMIRGGTTTYVDMYYFEDTIAEETKKVGMRAILGETVLDFPAPDNKTWPEALAYTERFLKRWAKDDLITPAIAPHAPYTVSTAHLEESRQMAERYNSPIVIHVAEAPTETEQMLKNFNERSVPYLDRIGFLSRRVIAAHVVHVNDAEIATLKTRGVGVGHCPQSNMKLASGVSPVPQMLKAGLNVGLGTDGAASNNDLDMWEEMDTAAKLHKLTSKNPTVVTALQSLEMATIGGARAINLEREIGSLESGKRADLILVSLSAPRQTPVYNLYSQLVYATKAADVSDMIVNGRVLMRNRRLLTIDAPAVTARARRLKDQVARSLRDAR
jgi:5-methylthioadenosine/S-adenosylhomocysteine deaminase